MTASASRCIHLISVAFQYSATLQTGGLSINCIYVLSVYPTLTFFISLDFILCGIAFGVNFFIVCRLKICINISNLVLTNCNSCCMISNVSGRHDRHNNLCASGSVGGARPCQGRGRGFESRLALSFIKKGHPLDVLFLIYRVLPDQVVRGLRSAPVGALLLKALAISG